MQINVIGSIFGNSGYDSHTRNLINSLCKFTDVRLSTQLFPGWESMCNDKELEMIKRRPTNDEINLIITHPMQWKMHLGKRNIVYLVWEGDRVPECFIDECLNPDVHKIIVPSQHIKDAIFYTIDEILHRSDGDEDFTEIMNKVVIINHGVNLELFYPKETNKEKFTFIANKGFRNLEDRGGLQYLIKSYLEEFKKEDNVKLLIKLNPAYGIPQLDKILIELGQTKDSPLIEFDINSYPYEKLVDFYNQGNIFVSPTRAEAFNLPGLEAKACGLPTIQTNFGGQVDYMKEGTDFFIDYDLTEVKHEIQYEGIKWATPIIEHLRKLMRYAFEHQDEIKEKGKKAREESINFTWDLTSQKIISCLG